MVVVVNYSLASTQACGGMDKLCFLALFSIRLAGGLKAVTTGVFRHASLLLDLKMERLLFGLPLLLFLLLL